MELVNAKELAKYLGLSLRTIRTYTKDKKIPYLKIGTQYRYDIEAVVKSMEVEQ